MANANTQPPAPLSADAIGRVLNEEVAKYVSRGYTVQSVGAGQAVLSKNKRIGWFWNTLLVLLTAGLWLIYVIYKALNRKQSTVIVTVDAYGKVSRR